MSNTDEWVDVPRPSASAAKPAPAVEEGWSPVVPPSSGRLAGEPAKITPLTSGAKAYESDVALVGEPSAAQAAEVFGRRAGQAATLGVSEHVVSAAQKGFGNYDTTKQELEAKSRLNPGSSVAGTATGTIGGMLVPLGWLGKPAQVAEWATRSVSPFSKATTEAVAQGVNAATTGAVLSGGSSYIEDQDLQKALLNASVGMGLGPAAQYGMSRFIGKIKGFDDPLTAQGGFTPQAQKAVDEAFWPEIQAGRMTVQDVEDLKPKIAEIFKSKGTSAAGAREAQLKEAGVENPTRSQVTGMVPTQRGFDPRDPQILYAQDQAKQGILSTLANGVPTAPTMPNVTAQNLYKAERASKAAAQAPYKAIEKEPGTFMSGVLQNDIGRNAMSSLDNALVDSRIPTNLKDLPQYPKAAEAYDFVLNTLATGNMPQVGNTPTFGNVSAESVMKVREGIGSLWKKADSRDRIAIDAIRTGFDKNIENAIQNGLFTGDGPKILSLMKQGTSGWAQYKNAFDGPGAADAIVSKAIDRLKDKSLANPTEIAQGILDSKLINNALGPSVYTKLEGILGKNSPEMSQVRDQLRASVVNTGGSPINIANNIDAMLGSGNRILAAKLFNQQEMRQMRMASQAIRTVEKAPMPARQANEKLAEVIMGNMPSGLLSLMAGAAGAAASHAMGAEPATAALAGAAATLAKPVYSAASMLSDRVMKARALERELSGTPVQTKIANDIRVPFTNLRAPITAPKAPLFTAGEQMLQSQRLPTGYGPAIPLVDQQERRGRKAGGRVSDRLMREVERSKKSINSDTESLLNTPDSHVAHALAIANRNLEG